MWKSSVSNKKNNNFRQDQWIYIPFYSHCDIFSILVLCLTLLIIKTKSFIHIKKPSHACVFLMVQKRSFHLESKQVLTPYESIMDDSIEKKKLNQKHFWKMHLFHQWQWLKQLTLAWPALNNKKRKEKLFFLKKVKNKWQKLCTTYKLSENVFSNSGKL